MNARDASAWIAARTRHDGAPSCHAVAMRARLVAIIVLAMTTPAACRSRRRCGAEERDRARRRQTGARRRARRDRGRAREQRQGHRRALRARLGAVPAGPQNALREYDRALQLDPSSRMRPTTPASCSRSTRDADAAARFDGRSRSIKHVDAAYNAGQAYYLVKDFKHAAERWTTAQQLAPDDFQTAKKLVQITKRALGDDGRREGARHRVRAVERRQGRQAQGLRVRPVRGRRARRVRTRPSTSGCFAVRVSLRRVRPRQEGGQRQRRSRPRISAATRGRRTSSAWTAAPRTSLGTMWKQLPAYKLRPLIVDVIKQKFP